MATPAIQTLLTDAQQVLNLNSLSEVRATMAAALANANVGTPLNPNLTTQQLWDEFYLIVRQPESDIESIITNQLMKFLFAPPAPGGVGANGQVIFNDGGVLAGDAGLTYNKATDSLTVLGNVGIGLPPVYKLQSVGIAAATSSTFNGSGGNLIGALLNSDDANSGANPGVDLRRWTGTAFNHGTSYIATNSAGDTLFYNGAVASNTRATSLKMTLDANGNLSLLSDKYLGWGNLDSLIYGSSTSNFIYFRTNATEQVRIDGSGNVDLKNGNVKVSNGKGIDFSLNPNPAGMTSELLNDYEEGTFTASITGGTTNPTTPVTTTARYTKIGRQVTVQISFENKNTTGASGTFLITGLPFVSASGFTSTGSVNSYAMITFTGSLSANIGSTESYITMLASESGAVWNAGQHNAGASRYLNTTLSYTVA